MFKIQRQKDCEIITWSELSTIERSDMMDDYDDIQESRFFRFENSVYDLNDFMKIKDADWHGHLTLTNTSAMVIKLSECGEMVTVGVMY